MKPKEVLQGKYIDINELTNFRKEIKSLKKKVVFVSGNWDLLHVGQMRYLHEAKKKGDVLVVGINSNASVRQIKGRGKPILDEWIRAESLVFLESVDFVTINPVSSCKTIIELLKPDVFITVGEEWNSEFRDSAEYKALKEHGGEVAVVERQSPFVSTTKIMKKVVNNSLHKIFGNTLSEKDKPLKERFSEEDSKDQISIGF